MHPRAALALLLACFALAVWFAHDTLLLIFAGILPALVLREGAERIARLLRLPVALAVWITALAGAALIGLGLILLGNAVASQSGELARTLPAAFNNAVDHLRTTPAGAWIANHLPDLLTIARDSTNVLSRATGLLSGAIGAVGAALIAIFVSIAAALEPGLYSGGFIALFPAEYRSRMQTALAEAAATLRMWLAARLLTMTVTGLLVTIGLTVLHVRFAGALGVFAAAMAFIPNVGAFIAAAPAVVLAFAASPQAALAVAAMYVGVHIMDDFIVGPFVERQVVKLPPVLTLAAQVILGIAAGGLGVMLAAPLVASAMVLVRCLWIEGVADAPESTFDVSRPA